MQRICDMCPVYLKSWFMQYPDKMRRSRQLGLHKAGGGRVEKRARHRTARQWSGKQVHSTRQETRENGAIYLSYNLLAERTGRPVGLSIDWWERLLGWISFRLREQPSETLNFDPDFWEDFQRKRSHPWEWKEIEGIGEWH